MLKINKNLCALCAIAAITFSANAKTSQAQTIQVKNATEAQTTEKVSTMRNRASEVAWVVPAISGLIILFLAVDFFKKEVEKSSGSDKIIQKMMEQKREYDC